MSFMKIKHVYNIFKASCTWKLGHKTIIEIGLRVRGPYASFELVFLMHETSSYIVVLGVAF